MRLATSNITTTEEIIRNVYGGEEVVIILDSPTEIRLPPADMVEETSPFGPDRSDTEEVDKRILALIGRTDGSDEEIGDGARTVDDEAEPDDA